MSRHKVAVLLVDQVLPLDFAIPLHIFGREAPEFYDVVTCTPDGARVNVAGGSSLVADGDLRLLRTAQTVIVPGYANAAHRALDPLTLDALRGAAGGGARMVSVCSGTFALAQAGLLAGLRVTTHWSLCAELADQYPDLTVEPSALFIDNGETMTSGGVTSGVDLCLHILRRDLGQSVTNHVARRIVAPPRRDGEQTQFVEPTPTPPGDDAVAAAQQWMLAVLDRPISVKQMAERANLSPRQFYRRFQERVCTTPLAWLHAQRIDRAKELLESTTLPMTQIAHRVGLGSTANFREHFRRATSISPSRHRYLFGLDEQEQSATNGG